MVNMRWPGGNRIVRSAVPSTVYIPFNAPHLEIAMDAEAVLRKGWKPSFEDSPLPWKKG